MFAWCRPSRPSRMHCRFVQYCLPRFDFCTSGRKPIATRIGHKEESIVSDVTIIGAGVAGLASIQRLRKDGFSVNAIESGNSVGGTWFWNRYPGAVCDIPSMEYSFQFDAQLQQDWDWTHKYSTQADILSYLEHVADKHDLRKHIHFEQAVEKCTYSESNSNWSIETSTGHKYTSQMLILATGSLSHPSQPKFDGIEDYEGFIYYTSKWPQNPVDFSDKKVAIIGTGSSGVQTIPKIAETAKHLTVYQRTAQYVCPLKNKKLSEFEKQRVKDNYDEYRQNAKNTSFGLMALEVSEKMFAEMTVEEYENALWEAWNEIGAFAIFVCCADQNANKDADVALSQFIRNRIREIVKDPTIAERLCPTENQLYSCKRPLCDTNYFQTYNRNNVELVSISDTRENGTPIKSITSKGIITSDDVERDCDVLIFATGFDALTGAALNINIKGMDETIQECWRDGPKTYLGLQTVGFPNMFTICGPHSPSVFTNMIPAAEQHVNWIADLMLFMKDNNLHCVEPTKNAQQEWVQYNAEVAEQTLFASPSCNSWYYGSNIDGKKRHFLASLMGFHNYAEKCNDEVHGNYMGFDFNLRSRQRKAN